MALSLLLTSGVKASVAVETSLPLPAALPMEASIAVNNNGRADDTLHKIALTCGLLALAIAGQQALFPRKSAPARIKAD
ncbi:MAG: hypothetical protein K8R87_02135 [Verrucomicrobia bacterium]|nr:hypothetical protein [Verrucomicrobiota bacterium]